MRNEEKLEWDGRSLPQGKKRKKSAELKTMK